MDKAVETLKRSENIFEAEGIKVAQSPVVIGKTYPVYGMITKISDQIDDGVIIEINFQIIAKLKISSVDQLSVLRERVLEPGIFVSKVVKTEPQVEVVCKKVIFGKKAEFNA